MAAQAPRLGTFATFLGLIGAITLPREGVARRRALKMILPIYQLLYVSQHENPVTNGGYSTIIYDIGLEATRRNQLLDVTGFLICTPRWFAQVLEGRQGSVDDLMARIGRDPRHHSIRILFTRTSGVRLFPNWSMGIATADSQNKSLFEQNGLSPLEAPTTESGGSLLELARDLSRIRT